MNYRVLVVDDEKDIVDLLKYNLEKEKEFVVITASNGKEALEYAVEYKPDLVLLDIMMPEMNGYQFLEALSNNTSLKVPVIVITNLTQERERQKAIQAGASLFLTKAEYDGPDLVTKVNELLANKPLQTASTDSNADVTSES